MSTERETDAAVSLEIGPTEAGAVRLWFDDGTAEFAVDFAPDEAEAIAEALRSAAALARGPHAKDRRQ